MKAAIPSPEGPLTRAEALALLTVCLANLRGEVIRATELPEQVGTAMWKLRRIGSGACATSPDLRRREAPGRLTRERMLAALTDEPQSPAELAERLDVDCHLVLNHLSRLRADGLAERVGRGAWRLSASTGEDARATRRLG